MKENRVLLLISSIFGYLFILAGLLIDYVFKEPLSTLSIVLYSLYFISASFFMYYSFCKEEKVNRGLIFLFSIILFVANILSGVLGFIYFKKTDKYKMRDLPKLEILHEYHNIVYIIVFLISMALIFILPLFIKIRAIKYSSEVLIVIVLAFLFRKDIKRDFKYFKEYFREYSKITYKMYFIALAVLFIINVSIRIFTGLEQATNQSEINKSFSTNPLLIILLAVLLAPFMEELLFRGIFKKVFNNKYVYLITSSIIFGALHVVDDFQSTKELLFILTYSSLGFFLGYLYHKTNNLFTNILFHFTQNTLAIIAIMILNIFVQ